MVKITECPNYKCPAFGGRCEEHRKDCPEYVMVLGKDPQDGGSVHMYDCARRWMPTLLVELSQRMNQMGSTNESFRNEMVKSQNTFNGIVAQAVNMITARRQEEPYKLEVVSPRPVKGGPHYVEDQGDGEVKRN